MLSQVLEKKLKIMNDTVEDLPELENEITSSENDFIETIKQMLLDQVESSNAYSDFKTQINEARKHEYFSTVNELINKFETSKSNNKSKPVKKKLWNDFELVVGPNKI